MHAEDFRSGDSGRVSPISKNAPLHGQSENSMATEGLSREQRIFDVQRRFDEKMGRPTFNERQAQYDQSRHERQERQALVDKGLARHLQYHTFALWLMYLFAIVVIFSWTVTCVLCYRPIGASSYDDQTGYTTRAQWRKSDAWRRAASIASTIVGAIGIPVTSAICAKAAAVHCQRRSEKRQPSLSLRQTMALADKGWSDLSVLLGILQPKTSRQIRSSLLMASSFLVALALLNPALQSICVHTVHIKVFSWDDSMRYLGPQVTPNFLATMVDSSIIDSVTSATIAGKLSSKEVYLWSGDGLSLTSVADNLDNSDMSVPNDLSEKLFTATYPVGTDTGVIRQLSLRLNSSIFCEKVSESDFPSSCPGNRPLYQNYTNIFDDSDPSPFAGDSSKSPKFRTQICAPGDYTASPWRGTGHRQDIFEELWIDTASEGSNFTLHCRGNSSLGYFELPNYWNGHTHGDLFEKMPENSHNHSYYESDLSPGVGLPDDPDSKVPGPFMTAVLAVFGNDTFFDITASHSNYSSNDALLCQQLRRPFTSMYADNGTYSTWWNESKPTLDCLGEEDVTDDDTFLTGLLEWLPNLSDPGKATAALTLATYLSNNAILNGEQGGDNFIGGIPIKTDPGSDMQKYAMSVPAMIIITILLLIQLMGLALMAHYASRHPSWTASLDSFALLRLGAAMAEDLPVLSSLQAKEASILDQKPGWMGDAGGEGQNIRSLAWGGPRGIEYGALYNLLPKDDKDD